MTQDYPERDPLPAADNTKQVRWIVLLHDNLAALFRDAPDIYVGANLFWYPVKGQPEVRMPPDVLVVFGRPKGDRRSYRQWEEGGVPVPVVFGVFPPKKGVIEFFDELSLYEDYGVEEYYAYQPDTNDFLVYLRQGDALRRVRQVTGFVSPRLGIRFDASGPELMVLRPDGQRFLTFEELEPVPILTRAHEPRRAVS